MLSLALLSPVYLFCSALKSWLLFPISVSKFLLASSLMTLWNSRIHGILGSWWSFYACLERIMLQVAYHFIVNPSFILASCSRLENYLFQQIGENRGNRVQNVLLKTQILKKAHLSFPSLSAFFIHTHSNMGGYYVEYFLLSQALFLSFYILFCFVFQEARL